MLLKQYLIFLVRYVAEWPWWPIKSLTKEERNRCKATRRERERDQIRSILLILDLKDSKVKDSGKEKARCSINCMLLGCMMICEIEIVDYIF